MLAITIFSSFVFPEVVQLVAKTRIDEIIGKYIF